MTPSDRLRDAAQAVLDCGVGNLSGDKYRRRVEAFDELDDALDEIVVSRRAASVPTERGEPDPRQPHGVSGLFRHEPGRPCVVCDRLEAAQPVPRADEELRALSADLDLAIDTVAAELNDCDSWEPSRVKLASWSALVEANLKLRAALGRDES